MMLTCPRCGTQIALGGVTDDDGVEIMIESAEGVAGVRISIKLPGHEQQLLREGQLLHRCDGQEHVRVGA